MKERFAIRGIQVIRTCLYKSTDTNSTLKISENYSLDFQLQGYIQGKPWSRIKAFLGPSDRKPTEKLGHWFEASISSVQLDSILEENRKLEIGEMAQWTPEQTSTLDIVNSICYLADEMLKKMDGVGQYNDNGFQVRPKVDPAASQVSEQTSADFLPW